MVSRATSTWIDSKGSPFKLSLTSSRSASSLTNLCSSSFKLFRILSTSSPWLIIWYFASEQACPSCTQYRVCVRDQVCGTVSQTHLRQALLQLLLLGRQMLPLLIQRHLLLLKLLRILDQNIDVMLHLFECADLLIVGGLKGLDLGEVAGVLFLLGDESGVELFLLRMLC